MTFNLTDPKLGTTVGDGYRLDEQLGAGGMGIVYKGVEVAEGRQVAVKFLHDSFARIPDLVKRFEREIVAMRRVCHPNLVTILDSGVSGGVPYLVMEFHSGHSLAQVIERGALPPARALRIAKQVLAGVAAAHESGVVHRDLKPDNILLVGTGEDECAKILDFGLAKMVHGNGSGATQLTNTGLALGTPAYMAPEQAKGTPTDHRADLYAVGVILYHMVVGKKPFVSDSPMAVMRMHMDDPPVPPRKAAPDAGISAALERVILRSMEKLPAARWQDAAAFARALDATPEGGGEEIDEEPAHVTRVAKKRVAVPRPPSRPWLGPRARTRLAQLTALALIAAGGLYGWHRLSRRDQQQVRHALDGAMDKAKDVMRTVAPKIPPPEPTPPVEAAHEDDDADDRDPAPPHDTPGEKLEAAAPAEPVRPVRPPRLSDAIRLIAANKPDEAVQLLYQLRKKTPRDPDLALWLGHAYFKKLWRTDGLREYDQALQWRPSLRRDTQLIRNSVWALDDPTYRLARAVLRKRVGASAVAELRRAARDGKNAKVEARAARLATELAHARSHR